MLVNIGAQPDHGFDEPLGLLSDCHRRIERFLKVLLVVSASRQGGELSAEECDALRRATEYFRTAAPRHTQDEEVSLFPLLRASNDPRVAAVLRDLARLEADHEAADQKHTAVDSLVDRWLEVGRLETSESQTLSRLLSELQAMYRNHIALEDDVVFPLASCVLKPQQIVGLGNEMAKRRHLPLTNAGRI
jgi:hemerythrin-like domain-containing protein